MIVLQQWFDRKLSGRLYTLREARTVEVKHSRALGPRGEFARIVMSGEPWNTFEYQSKAVWLDEGERFEAAICDGLIDEILTADQCRLVLNVRFTLLEVRDFHFVDSSPSAFYRAARMAVREIVGVDQFTGNTVRCHNET